MKIFVSSTFDDLRDHRHAVDDVVNRMRQEYIGMEYFGPIASEPVEACFAQIRQSTLFIGIYAHRYGWIPPGSTHSITEQEFDFAQNLGLPCYCFVVDQTYPWRPAFIEHDATSKLTAFRRKIDRLVRATFNTPENLALQVAACLQVVNVESSSGQSHEALRAQLASWVTREIDNSVGRKYIRRLYVDRHAGELMRRRLKDFAAPARLLSRRLNDFRNSLPSSTTSSVDYAALDRRVQTLQRRLAERPLLVYPEEQTNEELKAMAHILQTASAESGVIERRGRKHTDIDTRHRFQRLEHDFAREIRPIDLLVDRAGGGKTNLLCRLAEELSDVTPTFFLSAKSFPEGNADAILQSFARAYPVGADPIKMAAQMAQRRGAFALVIIDAINEHLEPKKLKTALPAFFSNYEGQAVRFVVSCRDIYWTYFDEDWWTVHVRDVVKGKIYGFRPSEFKRALRLYLDEYHIEAEPRDEAAVQLRHPLLLRFFCEAFQGTDGALNQLGVIRDIRLLNLFDTYCETKFTAIQKKLDLVSPHGVWEVIEMLARMMLTEGSRTLSVQQVTQEARLSLGEQEMRRLGSRYVSILDEDIIVEERLSGVGHKLGVNFVYDEFMEYAIAQCLWRDLGATKSRIRAYDIVRVATHVLEREAEFISVIGVIVYLGGLLAARAPAEGKQFVAGLVRRGRPLMAISVIERWPGDRSDPDLLGQLVRLHESGSTVEIRLKAWEALAKLSLWNWAGFLTYVRRMEMRGHFRRSIVAKTLGRLCTRISANDRLKALRVLGRMARSSGPEPLGVPALHDIATVARRLFAASSRRWKPSDLSEAERILANIEKQETAELARKREVDNTADRVRVHLSR